LKLWVIWCIRVMVRGRSPRGERGLKPVVPGYKNMDLSRSPRGERGLKLCRTAIRLDTPRVAPPAGSVD